MEHFYDEKALRHEGPETRSQSPIFPLRQFNNWVKACLIRDNTVSKGARVLDLCGGCGQDLAKWRLRNVSVYVLVDFSEASVREARARFERAPWPWCAADFLVADCAALPETLKPGTFDVVSCQFALHYTFDSEEHARNTLRTVASLLDRGGRFIGTLPSAERMAAARGNEFYRVTFDDAKRADRYTFWLRDAIDNVPEYLVQPARLLALAKEVGLVPVGPFPHSFEAFRDEHDDALEHMRPHALPQELWEVCSLYDVFIFEKL